MKKSLPDILISLALIAVLSAFGTQMIMIPDEARTYPMVILILGGILVIALFIKSVVSYKKEEKVGDRQQGKSIFLIVSYIVLITIYIMLIQFVGYIIATVLFILISLLYLKFKSKILLVVLAVGLTILIYYIFTKFLGVQLPRGTYVQFYF